MHMECMMSILLQSITHANIYIHAYIYIKIKSHNHVMDMGLVYGRKSEKNGMFFSRTRPLFLGMEGGSISGVMLGVGGKF